MKATRDKVEMVPAFGREPLPGIDMLTTEVARQVADRNQFRGGIGQHVYVNGYDLARVEAAGLMDPAVVAKLRKHGWDSPNGVQWFRSGTHQPRRLAEAVVDVITALESPKKREPAP